MSSTVSARSSLLAADRDGCGWDAHLLAVRRGAAKSTNDKDHAAASTATATSHLSLNHSLPGPGLREGIVPRSRVRPTTLIDSLYRAQAGAASGQRLERETIT